MKLSREWLGEYTTIGAPDKEYCDAMTMSGSKVEGWEVTGSEISRVVVGRVISMERHTNSDHMWVCKIDVGGERELQIVTGAQNVNIGDLVPVALDGSTLPGGKEIRTGKLRGEDCLLEPPRGRPCRVQHEERHDLHARRPARRAEGVPPLHRRRYLCLTGRGRRAGPQHSAHPRL